MGKKRNLKPLMKEMYIKDGLGIEDICTRLNCDRSSFYYHKNKDKALDIDWDELKAKTEYNTMSSSDNFEEDKKEFLTTLFNAFKKEKDEISNIEDSEQRLKRWNSFANNYHKFLKPSVHDCKGIADKSSRITLNIIIDLASQYEKNDLIDFLSDHFEEITTKTVESVKNVK